MRIIITNSIKSTKANVCIPRIPNLILVQHKIKVTNMYMYIFRVELFFSKTGIFI